MRGKDKSKRDGVVYELRWARERLEKNKDKIIEIEIKQLKQLKSIQEVLEDYFSCRGVKFEWKDFMSIVKQDTEDENESREMMRGPLVY